MLQKTILHGLLSLTFCLPLTLLARGGLAADTVASKEQLLEAAAENRDQIAKTLEDIPTQQAAALNFLLENMPLTDLQSLDADFILSHVKLAFDARAAAKWGNAIPETIFLNNVLPYANVNERRDDVRGELRNRFWPVVKNLDSPGLAAAKLNQEVFKQLGVKYSTKRRRADQGPSESMSSGLASCTGLSILLIDACRACGIPARFVGTPLWSDGSGNHSWVEVWDDGWHFTGAAEPTGDELDKAWFVGRASKATPDNPKHGIFAVSYQKTNLRFPLAWARFQKSVPTIYAENVTTRYAKPQKQLASGLLELQFRAINTGRSDRCQANLTVKNAEGQVVFRGQTNNESHDANDHLTAKLKPGKYRIELNTPAGTITKELEAKKPELVTFRVQSEDPKNSTIDKLNNYLESTGSDLDLALVQEEAFANVALTKEECEQATKLLTSAYLEKVRKTRLQEHESRELTIGERSMKFAMRTFGERPKSGHSLYISMHGGGGAPKRVNDRQWENQKRLYDLDEGIYVAPRAPTDSWNMWHQGHIDQLFTRLITNMIALEGVDPNRVYITGYSAGGDGVFQLAPRMADQLAAAAMMAGHPNETQPDGLYNLPFTLHMGANDSAYDRNEKAKEWKQSLSDLRKQSPAGYQHWVEIHAGKGHWMDREDGEGVKWLAQFTRNLLPKKVVWLQDDVVHARFYWLAVDPTQAEPRQRIVASRDGQTITIEEAASPELQFLLRDEMLNLDEDIIVELAGKQLFKGRVERNIRTIAETLVRGDPSATFPARLSVKLPN